MNGYYSICISFPAGHGGEIREESENTWLRSGGSQDHQAWEERQREREEEDDKEKEKLRLVRRNGVVKYR